MSVSSWARRGAAGAVALITGVAVSPFGPSGQGLGIAGAVDVPPNVAAVCGTWALQQLGSLAQLDNLRDEIDRALAFKNVRGLSLRYPWETGDQSLAILDAGKRISDARGRAFSPRFMAGRHTPERVFAAGAYYYLSPAGEKIPTPFRKDGTWGNPVFEQEYEAHVARLASWARAHGVREIHLPWYGNMWAEIDNGADIQAAPGYSFEAWLAGHKRLVTIASRYAGPDLAVEFPLTGYWGGRNDGAMELVDHMIEKFGAWSGTIFVQANTLGAYNVSPTSKAIYSGLQMFDGENYDWANIYGHLVDLGASYLEVYVSSFGLAGAPSLQAEITKFAATCPGASTTTTSGATSSTTNASTTTSSWPTTTSTSTTTTMPPTTTSTTSTTTTTTTTTTTMPPTTTTVPPTTTSTTTSTTTTSMPRPDDRSWDGFCLVVCFF